MHIFLLIVSLLLVTSACNGKISRTIGITTSGPDEYMVARNKSLEMPPHYELPPVRTEEEWISNEKKTVKDLNEAEKALIKELE